MRRSRERGGSAVRGTHLLLLRERGQKFIAQKVPSQCPLVLLVKVGRRQGEEGSVVGTGLLEVRSRGKGLSLEFRGQNCDESFVTLGRLRLDGKFEFYFRRAAPVACSATWISCAAEHLVRGRGKPQKTLMQMAQCKLTSRLQSSVQAHER